MSGPNNPLKLVQSVRRTNNNLNICKGALVCQNVELIGEIHVGANTIIHPRASIIAQSGPIIIGEYCIIEERARIINNGEVNPGTRPIMVIGSYNHFQVDCVIEGTNIGSENIFEYKCFIGNQVMVSDQCSIGASCKLVGPQKLEPFSVVYGDHCLRRKNIAEWSYAQDIQQQIATLKQYMLRYLHFLPCNQSK